MRHVNIPEALAGQDMVSIRGRSETADGTYEQKRHTYGDADSMRTAMLAAPQLDENVRERRRDVWMRRVPRCYALEVELSFDEKVCLSSLLSHLEHVFVPMLVRQRYLQIFRAEGQRNRTRNQARLHDGHKSACSSGHSSCNRCV
jgi:hypothetical protein